MLLRFPSSSDPIIQGNRHQYSGGAYHGGGNISCWAIHRDPSSKMRATAKKAMIIMIPRPTSHHWKISGFHYKHRKIYFDQLKGKTTQKTSPSFAQLPHSSPPQIADCRPRNKKSEM